MSGAGSPTWCLLWAPGELTQVTSQDQAWRGGDARAGCLLSYGHPHRGDSEAVHSQSFYALVSVPSVSLRTPRPLCYLPLRVPCIPQCLARRRHSKDDYGIKAKWRNRSEGSSLGRRQLLGELNVPPYVSEQVNPRDTAPLPSKGLCSWSSTAVILPLFPTTHSLGQSHLRTWGKLHQPPRWPPACTGYLPLGSNDSWKHTGNIHIFALKIIKRKLVFQGDIRKLASD